MTTIVPHRVKYSASAGAAVLSASCEASSWNNKLNECSKDDLPLASTGTMGLRTGMPKASGRCGLGVRDSWRRWEQSHDRPRRLE